MKIRGIARPAKITNIEIPKTIKARKRRTIQLALKRVLKVHMHIDFYYYGLLLVVVVVINLYSLLFRTCHLVGSYFFTFDTHTVRANDDVMILFGMRVLCINIFYIFSPGIQTKQEFETISK